MKMVFMFMTESMFPYLRRYGFAEPLIVECRTSENEDESEQQIPPLGEARHDCSSAHID
jgi:hypothetical protein